MPSEASDYTIYSMVMYQIQNYHQNLIWLGYLALFVILGFLGFAVWPERFYLIRQIGYTACVFAGFYYLMQKNMFNMKYSTKLCVFQWAVFLLTATIVAGVITIFRSISPDREKLLACMGILIIVLTPLGSNNHLYSSINNLFLVAPFTLFELYLFLKWMPLGVLIQTIKQRERTMLYGGYQPGFRLYLFPLKAMIVCMFFMLLVQSIGFGFGYVFSESDGGENLHTKIEGSKVLTGMYTSPDRAKVLEEVIDYVKQQGLEGRSVILYGDIPAMSYYLQMPFAITAWPDLESYNYGVMESDLEKLSQRIAQGGEIPVILLEADCISQDQSADPKMELLREWSSRYSYYRAFENEKFILLLPQETIACTVQ